MPQIAKITSDKKIELVNIKDVSDCIDILKLNVDDKCNVNRCMEDDTYLYEIMYKLDNNTDMVKYNEIASKIVYSLDEIFGDVLIFKNKYENNTYSLIDINHDDVLTIIEIRAKLYGTLVKSNNNFHIVELRPNEISIASEINIANVNVSFILLFNNDEINEYVSKLLKTVIKGDAILFFKLQNGILPIPKKFIINSHKLNKIDDMRHISIPKICN